ncbi:MAG: chitinase [Sediminibacterium sp.]|nr:chitinase [Sediminibacterium sp.]
MIRFFRYGFLLIACMAVVALHAQSLPPVSKYLSRKQWNQLFPNRYSVSKNRAGYDASVPTKDFYSYDAFIKAAKRFPGFLSKGSTVQKKRELAAFLANIAHETSGGWDEAPGGYFAWGLYFVEEKGCSGGCDHYSDTTKKLFPPVAGQSYHGRGPIQLSWNYNYAQFSSFYFKKQQILLNNPALLVTDPVLSFASAIWFWITPQYPKPSCHEIMSGKWIPEKKDSIAGRLPGFGAVMNVINGGIECGGTNSQKAAYRLNYYKYFCRYFKVDPGPAISCENQRPFGL